MSCHCFTNPCLSDILILCHSSGVKWYLNLISWVLMKWASFPVYLLSFFSSKMSIQVFPLFLVICLFKNQLVGILYIFCILIFWQRKILSTSLCKYFLPICGVSFHFLYGHSLLPKNNSKEMSCLGPVVLSSRIKGQPRASLGFPGGAAVENLPANAGDTGSSPGLGRSHMPQSN